MKILNVNISLDNMQHTNNQQFVINKRFICPIIIFMKVRYIYNLLNIFQLFIYLFLN